MSTKQRRGQLPRGVVASPALDPEASLPDYVRELLDQGVLQVVVVTTGAGRTGRTSLPPWRLWTATPCCATRRTRGKAGR